MSNAWKWTRRDGVHTLTAPDGTRLGTVRKGTSFGRPCWYVELDPAPDNSRPHPYRSLKHAREGLKRAVAGRLHRQTAR